jgi:hypothetical protein
VFAAPSLPFAGSEVIRHIIANAQAARKGFTVAAAHEKSFNRINKILQDLQDYSRNNQLRWAERLWNQN